MSKDENILTVNELRLRQEKEIRELQHKQQRFEAALKFVVAFCGKKGMATNDDIRYAVEQADRLIVKLEETRA